MTEKQIVAPIIRRMPRMVALLEGAIDGDWEVT